MLVFLYIFQVDMSECRNRFEPSTNAFIFEYSGNFACWCDECVELNCAKAMIAPQSSLEASMRTSTYSRVVQGLLFPNVVNKLSNLLLDSGLTPISMLISFLQVSDILRLNLSYVSVRLVQACNFLMLIYPSYMVASGILLFSIDLAKIFCNLVSLLDVPFLL